MTNGTDNTPISDDMLHAFVDGQLPDDEMAVVEQWLNENPEKAEEVLDWFDQNEAIDALFPIPTDMPNINTTRIPEPDLEAESANTNAAPSDLSWSAIAAALTMLAVGLGGGWFARGNVAPSPQVMASLVQQAVQAHAVYSVDPHRAVEIKANEEELLVRWLSNRVGEQLEAPDLTSQGFELAGGRLLAVSEGPAAQFLYENADGKRITLFAVKGATGQLASFNFNQDGDTGSFYWEDENLSYAIVGDADKDTLNALAIQVFDQLSL